MTALIFLGVFCLLLTIIDLSSERCLSKRLFFYSSGRIYDYRMDMLIDDYLTYSYRVMFDTKISLEPIAVRGSVSFKVVTSVEDFGMIGIIAFEEDMPSWYNPNMRPSFEKAGILYNRIQAVLREYYRRNLLE